MYDLLKANAIIFAFGLSSTQSISLWYSQMGFEGLYPQTIDISKNKIRCIDIYAHYHQDTTCYDSFISFGFSKEGYMTHEKAYYGLLGDGVKEVHYRYNGFGALNEEIHVWDTNRVSQKYTTEYSNDKRTRTTIFEETFFYSKGSEMTELKEKNRIGKYAKEVFELDASGKILLRSAYDVTSHVGGNWFTYFKQDFNYDAKGRLIKVTTADTMKNIEWFYHSSSDFLTYDNKGNVSKLYSANRRIHSDNYFSDDTSRYDIHNYEYDKSNRMIKDIYIHTNTSEPSVLSEWTYDKKGGLLRHYHKSETNTYTYNDRGLPAEKRVSYRGKLSVIYKYRYKYYD